MSAEGVDPTLPRVHEAQEFLRLLGFDAERSNERSARVLLALLQLPPERPWAQATNPTMRTVAIMAWIREYPDHDYKPNTRETLRRQTLHQFTDALLLERNSDEPQRPLNSSKWCYRVHADALELAATSTQRRRPSNSSPTICSPGPASSSSIPSNGQ